jgi:hypothetical protein
LSALKQTNPAAIEAARTAAATDREARLDAQRRQLEIVKDLGLAADLDAEKFKTLRIKARELEARYKSAEDRYNEARSAEKAAGASAAGRLGQRHATASIVERAAPAAGNN